MAEYIDRRPSRRLWAPGDYTCRCLLCGGHFIGDKRAVNCADCAYAMPPPVTDVVGEGPGFEPKARARRCETCAYWGPIPADTFTGKCRWGPPNPGGGWTRTVALDWCGKWGAKPIPNVRLHEPHLTTEPDFVAGRPMEPENHQAISEEEFRARAWGTPRTDIPPRRQR